MEDELNLVAGSKVYNSVEKKRNVFFAKLSIAVIYVVVFILVDITESNHWI